MLKDRFFIKLLFAMLSIFFVENIAAQSYNRPVTGWSPYNNEGIYSGGKAQLTIKNNAYFDIVVRVSLHFENEVIRDAYVRSKESFTMNEIPEGTYDILFLYDGNKKGWDPTKKNDDGSRGDFKLGGAQKFGKHPNFEDNDKGYSIYTITLHPAHRGNTPVSSINKSEFFKKSQRKK